MPTFALPISLTDLADVAVSDLMSGQGIIWNGSEFVNEDISGGSLEGNATGDINLFGFNLYNNETEETGIVAGDGNAMHCTGVWQFATQAQFPAGIDLQSSALTLDGSSSLQSDGSGNAEITGFGFTLATGNVWVASSTGIKLQGGDLIFRDLDQEGSSNTGNLILNTAAIDWDGSSNQVADGSGNVTLTANSFVLANCPLWFGGEAHITADGGSGAITIDANSGSADCTINSANLYAGVIHGSNLVIGGALADGDYVVAGGLGTISIRSGVITAIS